MKIIGSGSCLSLKNEHPVLDKIGSLAEMVRRDPFGSFLDHLWARLHVTALCQQIQVWVYLSKSSIVVMQKTNEIETNLLYYGVLKMQFKDLI